MKLFTSLAMSLALTASAWAGVTTSSPVLNQGSLHHASLQGLRLEQQTNALLKHQISNNIIRKAKAEEVNVEGADVIFANYTEETQDWYIIFNDVTGRYRLYLDMVNAENPGTFAGIYFYDNIVKESTFLLDFESGGMTGFSDLLVVAQGEDPTVAFEITGSGTLETGESVSFHMLKSQAIEPTETLELTATLDDVVFDVPEHNYCSMVTATSTDGAYVFQVSYNANIGYSNQLDLVNSRIVVVETGEVIGVDHGCAEMAVNNDLDVHFTAEVVGVNAVQYNITVDGKLKLNDEVTIEANNLATEDLWGFVWFLTASTAEYPTIQGTMYSAPEPGDATDLIDFYMVDAEGRDFSSLLKLSAVISEDVAGNLVLDAKFVGTDMSLYNLHLYYELPEVGETRSFVATRADLLDVISELGVIQIMANADEGEDYLSLVFDAQELASAHYTAVSADYKNFCYVELAGQAEGVLWCDVDLTIEDQHFSLTGTCQAGTIVFDLAVSGMVYDVAHYGSEYDDRENDLTLAFTTEQVEEFVVVPADGYAYLRASNGEQVFATVFFVDGPDLEPGTYTINGTHEPGSVQPGEVSNGGVYPTFCANIAPEGYYVPLWLCVDGTISVCYVDDEISLIMNATNTWGRSVCVTVNADLTGIQSVTEAKLQGKALEDGNIVIRSNGQQYNAFGQLTR